MSAAPPLAAPAARHLGTGLLIAAVAAVFLGLAPPSARYAYEGGSNGLTVSAARGAFMLTTLFVFMRLAGRPLALPRPDLPHALGCGLLFAGMLYFGVAAVQYIPVGLAALVYFTYPPMIALLLALVLKERVAPGKVGCIALAFCGLLLMLGTSFGAVDPLGVALAVGAAMSVAGNAVWVGRRLAHLDILAVTFHMCWVAFAALLAACLLGDAVAWPATGMGWAGFLGVMVLQTTGSYLYFIAIPRVGALRSGIVSNIQPVTSLLAAMLLFGELLTPLQLAGGLLVLGAVWLMQWQDMRRAKPG